MALTLCSTDNTLFPLAASEQTDLSASWDFFSGLTSGRWVTNNDEEVHTVPFTAEQLERFFTVAGDWILDYHPDLDDTSRYFGPKSDKWLLSLTLPQDAPLELLRRVGVAEYARQHRREERMRSLGRYVEEDEPDYLFRVWCPDSLRKPLVDKYVVRGALEGVSHGTLKQDLSNLQEFETAKYTTVVRACKELGDDYYEAYFAVTASRGGSLPLATYEHVETLLQYHYEESKRECGVYTKFCPVTFPEEPRGDKLPLWKTSGFFLPHEHPWGMMTYLEPTLYVVVRDTLRGLLGKNKEHDKHIVNWLIETQDYVAPTPPH